PEHPDHAVAAALDMLDALNTLNAQWRAEGRPELDIGIGINTGPMIAGNIGSEAIMSYTVVGDAVNLGSRLESLNKEYGTRIIISETTRDRLKKAQEIGEQQKKKLDDVMISAEEERQIGEEVSAKIRQRFGVVQNAGVHKYVTLVGTMVARQSERPALPRTFIVLDTDGVNAFASPGGIVHITR